ncbi:hypothetical protein [Streptomyces sp. NPDC007856]|uniref:hypothetical protein n=1 Tax=Streptomyces sp. NPDC007856 TaxID=3364781 RepID=UPI0036C032F1
MLLVYRRVVRESMHVEGSIAMLERLLPWWPGKIFVLVLLGFAYTSTSHPPSGLRWAADSSSGTRCRSLR